MSSEVHRTVWDHVPPCRFKGCVLGAGHWGGHEQEQLACGGRCFDGNEPCDGCDYCRQYPPHVDTTESTGGVSTYV